MAIAKTCSRVLSAVYRYAANGTPIFPTNPLTKAPLVPSGLHAATTDRAALTEWWEAWPSAMIGMPTGRTSGVYVLDVDVDETRGIDGDASLAQLPELPETVEVLTQRGRHLYWTLPDGYTLRNSSGKVGPGLDIRGDGGYVIIPPSMRADGYVYEYEASNPARPAEMPEWLMLAAGAVPAHGQGADEKVQPRAATAPDGAFIVSAYATYREGERNDGLIREAGKLRRANFQGEEITAALLAVNQLRCRPPLPDPEVRAIAGSVLRYQPEEVEESGATPEERLIPIYPAGEWVRDLRPPEYVWDGVLERGSHSVIVGGWGSGKTAVASDLTMRISAAMQCQGRKTSGGHWIYIAAEGQGGFKRRLVAWSIHHGEIVPDNFHVIPIGIPINDPAASAALRDTIYRYIDEQLKGESPIGVTLDTLARNFGTGDEDKNSDMQKHADAIQRYLIQPFGCHVMELHHTGHGNKERGRGGSALPAAVDAELLLYQDIPGWSSMISNKLKDGEPLSDPLNWRLEGVAIPQIGNVSSVVACESKDKPATDGRPSKGEYEALEILRAMLADARAEMGSRGQNPNRAMVDGSAWSAAYQTATKKSDGTFRKIKSRLHEKGLVAQDGVGWVPTEPF